jgi:PHD/YefM family antitoxin component YafN of YafNO toxin-antitoxin module
VIDLRDIRPVTDFQRNMKQYVALLKHRAAPLVLTVNGRAELVVQDADSYQALLERLDRAEAAAAIKEGLAEFAAGAGKPAGDALRTLRRRHGVSG